MVVVVVKSVDTRGRGQSAISKLLRNNCKIYANKKLRCFKSWFQQKSLRRVEKSFSERQGSDDALPKFTPPEFRFTPKIDDYSRDIFSKGFPVTEPFYSGIDFTYQFTRSKLKFETAEHIIQLPARGNFPRFPVTLTLSKNFEDGLVFINSMSPIIIFGNRDGPISKWYVGFRIHRSYNQCNFDAAISVSCEIRKDKREFQLALELQVLDRFDRIYSSRACHNGFKFVSHETIARYSVPNILDLRALEDKTRNLIHDSKCRFKIILTCLEGYDNDEKDSAPFKHHDNSVGLSAFKSGLSNGKILVRTLTGTLLVDCRMLTPLMLIQVHDGTMNLRNFTATATLNVLRFNSNGKFKSRMLIFELLETLQLAHQFQNHQLKGACLALLVENMTPSNAAIVLLAAFVFQSDENLRSQIKQYFIRNMGAILKSKNIRHLAKKFPRAFVEIMFGPICWQNDIDFGSIAQTKKTILPLAPFLNQAFHSLAKN